ncbi:CPBP family intramembrane glutamic endopeptidase [Spirochaeta cellobiosiphila]|uniref:CPBP family intramembrane glutamic endopeptidase n=1 Tax=Spirochaeta cellobiosiphila TaxID=504483 RepID=UPI0004190DAA|nr:CPBP family intramembrane glutamic endopeptidase [Spirochaeta cellobiosiphila]
MASTTGEENLSNFKFIISIIIGFFIFMFSGEPGTTIVNLIVKYTKFDNHAFFIILHSVLKISVFLILLKLYTSKILHVKLSYFRVGKPNVDLFIIIQALLLPVLVIAFYLFFLDGKIDFLEKDKIPLSLAFVVKTGLVAGITEEIFFRGFLMKLLENKWNEKIAILLPSFLFALLHIFKGMGLISTILLVSAGTLVAIMFSLVTYCSNNVWNSVVFHVLWNTIILRIFTITPEVKLRGIFNYSLDHKSVLLTGGNFGIESGIPAIIAYLLIILITIIRYKRNRKTGNSTFNKHSHVMNQKV